MSRLNKAAEIIELAMMFQNSYSGLCIDDIQEHFECSRRSAERMKSLLFEMFPEKVEEVPTSDKKKRWRFVKGTANMLISFTPDDFANFEYLRMLSNDEHRQKELDELIPMYQASEYELFRNFGDLLEKYQDYIINSFIMVEKHGHGKVNEALFP